MSYSVSRHSRPSLGVAVRAALCIAGGALLAVNVRTFVHTGGLLPGGFVGLALLIRTLHKRYKRHTLIVVTDRATEVAALIHRETRHGSTRFDAVGVNGEVPHQIVYSVVDSDEVTSVVRGIRELDPKCFVNAFKTDFVSGYWYERPED